MTAEQLLEEIESQRNVMSDVSTGGARIQLVNDDYKARRERIRVGLAECGIEDPNPFTDLWRWYDRWSSGDLPSWRSRRAFLAELYDPLIDELKRRMSGVSFVAVEPTGWARVDRGTERMRAQLERSKSEEDFQGVGLLCREILISLAQAVFDPQRHGPVADKKPSDTDAKRMLEAYISEELPGGGNEEARRYAKAAIDLANALQHRRTASFRDAAICAEATSSVVNMVAIISGNRDPE
jgi:hypothetical protein